MSGEARVARDFPCWPLAFLQHKLWALANVMRGKYLAYFMANASPFGSAVLKQLLRSAVRFVSPYHVGSLPRLLAGSLCVSFHRIPCHRSYLSSQQVNHLEQLQHLWLQRHTGCREASMWIRRCTCRLQELRCRFGELGSCASPRDCGAEIGIIIRQSW